jgi:hypothetical protein
MPKVKKIRVGYLYKTDGTIERVLPASGKEFTWDELRKYVGGYIESLISGIKGCKQMYCNEEGVLKGLAKNPHTWVVVNAKVYQLNGYTESWRVGGNIIALLLEEVKETTNGKA